MSRLQNTVTSYKTASLICTSGRSTVILDLIRAKGKVLTVTREKTPIAFDYTLDGTALTRFSEEKDLGVIITSTLSSDSHIHTITSRTNKLLSLLKRTCPLLTGVSIRRSLYMSLVKPQVCFTTQVWSAAYITLNAKVEPVQRRASRWILRTRRRETADKERPTLLTYFRFL